VELYFAEPKGISEQGSQISNTLKTATESILQKRIETIPSKAAAAMGGDANLIVAIGSEALVDILSEAGSAPVIAVFISKGSFETIFNNSVHLKRRPFTAVFSDSDPKKQIALAKTLFGDATTTAVIASPNVETYVAGYKSAANELDVNLTIIDFDELTSTSSFIEATQAVESLFLLKDQDLFQQISLEKILLSSYDINHQGVIGYSRGIVKNGGSATTYSSLQNIAHAIALQARHIDSEKPLDKPHFTPKFEVFLNKYVLRSLDVPDITEDAVQLKISTLIEGSTK